MEEKLTMIEVEGGNMQPVRLARCRWLVRICFERKVLLAGCWCLVCYERKVLLAVGRWPVTFPFFFAFRLLKGPIEERLNPAELLFEISMNPKSIRVGFFLKSCHLTRTCK
jgi:hypothetical protein